jgi:hypothetical protein
MKLPNLKINKLIAICLSSATAAYLTGCQMKERQDQAVATNPTPVVVAPVATPQPSATADSIAVVGEVQTGKSPTVTTPQPSEAANLKPPQIIFITNDKTGSTKSSKVPSLTIDSVMPLVREVAKYGGEVRIGNTCTDSDLPLVAFYSPEPPSPVGTPPQKPTLQTAGNPLNLPKLNTEYRKQLEAHQQQEAARNHEVAERDRSNAQKMDTFSTRVQALLKQPANCGATDIIGMMKRADLYMNEPDGNWRQKPRKVALLITDGLETVKANPKPIEWTAKAEVVLVSSGGEAGILKPLLTNTPFESIDAAVRYIIGR